MKPFWRGFEEKNASQVSFKKHVIVFYWSDEHKGAKAAVDKTRLRHPTVKVKTVKVSGDPALVKSHEVRSLPTIILLKNGQEVDRLTGDPGTAPLDQFFRKAGT